MKVSALQETNDISTTATHGDKSGKYKTHSFMDKEYTVGLAPK